MKVGTFNLNNLFSRFNYHAEIEKKKLKTGNEINVEYVLKHGWAVKTRTYGGDLVPGKDALQMKKIASRIINVDIDVLAVQEVEDLDTLREFNSVYLDCSYQHIALIEGNDDRLIDVGILSKYPFGCISSWQSKTHNEYKNIKVFQRDLLEVELLDMQRSNTLFTLYNTHLKSNFIDYSFDEEGKKIAQQDNNNTRKRESDCIGEIISKRMSANSNFILVGDMNDSPDSKYLKGFTANENFKLIDGLEKAQENRAYKNDPAGNPLTTRWTHRYVPRNGRAQYALFDHIWLSPNLAKGLTAAWIDRRLNPSGDGSDHDLAWVELTI